MKTQEKTKTFVALTISDLLGFFIGLFVSIVMARLLSKADFGVFRETQFVYSFLAAFFLFEIPAAILFFLPRFKEEEQKIYLLALSLLGIISALLMIIVFLVFSGSFESYFTKTAGTAPLFLLASISAPFSMLFTFYRQIFITLKKSRITLYLNLINALLGILPIIATLYFFDNPKVVRYLILVGVIQNLIPALLGSYWIFFGTFPSSPFRVRFRDISAFARRNLKDHLKYIWPMILPLPLSLLAKNLDRWLIVGALSTEAFAIYVIGAKQIPMIGILRNAFMNISVPEIAAEYHQSGKVPPSALESWRNGIRLMAMVFIPAFVFLEIFSHEFIVGLYSSKYTESVPIFRVYAFSIPYFLLSFGYFILGTGKTQKMLIANIIYFSTIFVLCSVFIKVFRLVGPAIGIMVGNFAMAGYYWWEEKKILGGPVLGSRLRKDLVSILIEALLAGLVLKIGLWLLLPGLDILLRFILGLAGSGLLLLLIWKIRRNESLREIWNVLLRIAKRT